MNKAIFVNEKTNTITFKDGRFYPADDKPELFFPGATTILQVAPKGATYYEWLKRYGNASDTIAMEAMERGSNVHDLCEQYDNLNEGEEISARDGNGNIIYTKDEWEMFHKYLEFSALAKPEIIKNEFSMCHSSLGYGGTLDRVMKIGNDNWLIDLKTGNIYDYYWMQIAAYKKLFEVYFPDIPIHRLGILHLNSKTRGADKKGISMQGQGWCLEEITNWSDAEDPEEYYWKLFLNCKDLWNFQNPKFKPDEKVFQLSVKKV